MVFATEEGAIVQGIDIDKENLDALSSTCKLCQIPSPSVEVKSILDTDWVNHFANQFSVAHSWGVLHHTGNLEQAFTNCVKLLRAEDAYLVIAIYNRHWSSPIWWWIKRFYNCLPAFGQAFLAYALLPVIAAAKAIVTRANPFRKERGMSFFYDVIDWVGGFPYEYRSKEQVCSLAESLDLKLLYFRASQVPTGCNEFVFAR